MAYADFDFYKKIYHGFALKEAEFAYYAERATEYIDSKMGVVVSDENVQKACCAVADAMLNNANGGGVVSEKVGEYSVNFADGISNTKSPEQRLFDTLKTYFKMGGWV